MAKKNANLNSQKNMQSKIDKMFYLVKDENDKVVICVGGYAVSAKRFDTFEQADTYLGTKPWEVIVNLNYVILTKHNNEKTMDEDPQNK